MGLVLNSSPFWSMCTPAGMQFRRYHLKHRNYRLHGQPCREATLRRGECRLKDVQVNSMALLESGSIVTCVFQFILYLLLLFFWGICIWERMRKKREAREIHTIVPIPTASRAQESPSEHNDMFKVLDAFDNYAGYEPCRGGVGNAVHCLK